MLILSDLIILPIKIYVGTCTCKYFINGITDRHCMLEKRSLIIYGMSVSSSLINLSMALQIKNTRQKFLFTPSR